MTSGAPRPSGVGLLTRTILQIEGGLSVASSSQVTRALQRVLGVLLAEVKSGSARATVAHDDAVTTASLLAAAGGAGVRAKIVPDRAAAAPCDGAASPQRPAWYEWLPIVATAVFAALAVTAHSVSRRRLQALVGPGFDGVAGTGVSRWIDRSPTSSVARVPSTARPARGLRAQRR
jgi:hypothetical protein